MPLSTVLTKVLSTKEVIVLSNLGFQSIVILVLILLFTQYGVELLELTVVTHSIEKLIVYLSL